MLHIRFVHPFQADRMHKPNNPFEARSSLSRQDIELGFDAIVEKFDRPPHQ
jgi:hypothetical protein